MVGYVGWHGPPITPPPFALGVTEQWTRVALMKTLILFFQKAAAREGECSVE